MSITDPKVQYQPEKRVPVREEYWHPGLTDIQLACRTSLTRGFAERDYTNWPAKYRLDKRRSLQHRKQAASNNEFAQSLAREAAE